MTDPETTARRYAGTDERAPEATDAWPRRRARDRWALLLLFVLAFAIALGVVMLKDIGG